MRDLILYGAGGFGSEIASMCESECTAGRDTWRWNVVGFVDDRPEFHGQTIHGVPCLGAPQDLAAQRKGEALSCHIAIGDNRRRAEAAARIKALGWAAATVVHHSAYLSWETEVGEGSFVGPHVTISPHVAIGRHVLINTRASIGHHARIGDFTQVSLGASLLGHASIAEGAMIGAHGVVMSHIEVGAWATVAIGTPVMRNVQPGHTVSLPLAKTLFKRNVETASGGLPA